jgi:hypothetical protein
MSNLLKEAIADAKAVRETALQNAKMALEEAFTPQLKSMLSAKLREEDDELEAEVPAEEEEELGLEPEVPAEEGEYIEDEIPVEIPAEEGELEVEPEIPAEEGDYGVGEEDEISAEVPVVAPEEEEEDGLDLEAVIRELETELKEEADDDDDDDDEEELDESAEDTDNAYDENDPGEDPKHVGGTIGENAAGIVTPAEEDELEEIFDIDSDLFKEEDLGNGNPDEKDNAFDEDGEYDIKEQSGSSEIGSADNKVDVADASDEEDPEKGPGVEQAKLGEAYKQLKEYKEAVVYLKDKLHEVNILNAKLLFTNKLFKAFALDNNQKLKVVETFDRAQTTREIKLVYSTLAEQFGDNSTITRKKSINESASSAVSSTKPKSKKIISEEVNVANRFKKLAGIIK